MAKKASTNATLSPTHEAQVTIMALERAAQVLKESMGKGGKSLAPGGYPVALSIDITGDVVKGVNYRTQSKEGCSISDEELLVALCVGKSSSDIREMLVEAFDHIDRSQTTPGQAMFAAATTTVQGFVREIAQERKYWAKKPGQSKKGPVSGKPRVEVTGTVGVNKADLSVMLTIEGESTKEAA